MKYMVSACLLGQNCKYNGGNNRCEELIAFLKDKEVIDVCPEVLGGLSIPRLCCERNGNQVINSAKEDVSEAFKLGANKAVKIAKDKNVDIIITQPRSPSCGVGLIYDGEFRKTLIKGNGCFAEQLLENSFEVINCDEFLNKIKEF